MPHVSFASSVVGALECQRVAVGNSRLKMASDERGTFACSVTTRQCSRSPSIPKSWTGARISMFRWNQ